MLFETEVWAIRDETTGEWWSRNTWGTTTSVPDLYQSATNAKYQTDHPNSKMNDLARYSSIARRPKIVKLYLKEMIP